MPVFLLTVLLMVMTGSALASLGLSDRGNRAAAGAVRRAGERGRARLLQHGGAAFPQADAAVGYEFKEGVPAEARTLVVVPTLIGSRDDVEETVRKLEVHHLANIDGRAAFRAAVRLARQRCRAERRPTRRSSTSRAPKSRGSIAIRRQSSGVSPRFLSAAPPAALQPIAEVLDGLGAQARQAARAQPSPARRSGHDVLAARRAAARETSCMS